MFLGLVGGLGLGGAIGRKSVIQLFLGVHGQFQFDIILVFQEVFAVGVRVCMERSLPS